MIVEGTAVETGFLVAGMHRSGTSALARVLAVLGAELPRTLMPARPDNPKGFWESELIAQLNENILNEYGSSWDDPLAMLAPLDQLREHPVLIGRVADILAREFTLNQTLVLKEPRVSLLLGLWLNALDQARVAPKVIIPLRDPLEVSASLAARDHFSVGRSLLLWLTYFLLTERNSRHVPRVFVEYESIVADWRSVAATIQARLGAPLLRWTPAAELEIDRFVSRLDQHHRSTTDVLMARSDVAEWVKVAYQWALAAARGAEPDPAILDAIAEDFANSLRVFGPIIAEQRASIGESGTRIGQLAADLNMRDEQIALQAAQLQAQGAEVARHDHLLRETERQLHLNVEDLREREQRLESLELDLMVAAEEAAAHKALAEQESAAFKLQAKEELARYKARVEESESLAAQAQASHERLRLEFEEFRHDTQRLRRDFDMLRTASVRAQDELTKARAQREAARDDLQALNIVVFERTSELAALQARSEEIEQESAMLADSLRRHEAMHAELRLEIARRLSADKAQQEHIRALEESLHIANERADSEVEKRQEAEAFVESQRRFIQGSTPVFRRVRRALWRHSALQPISYVVDMVGLARRHGLRKATQLTAAARGLRASGLFDTEFYLERAWDVAAAGQDPVVHYLAVGAAEGRDPSRHFSTRAYLARYPDVTNAGANPLVHYVRHGRSEGRIADVVQDQTPRRAEAEIAPANVPVVEAPPSVDPYSIRPDDAVTHEAERGARFLERFNLNGETPDWAGAVAAINARAGDGVTGQIDATIIVPVYGQLPHTLNCLDSLVEHRSRFSAEILIVNDCSPDNTREWIDRVRGIRVLHREKNGGFIAACNEGAQQAQGRYVVLLNNDTRVVEGWLDELIGHLEDDTTAGLVGSKLLYPTGSLQEAGGIVWQDGSAWNYGRDDDPNKPEYCYARQVDYCSGASIALPRALWNDLHGFDTHYAPAYCEDTDLAFRVRHAAKRGVWYQPLSRVIHYEGITSGRDLTKGVKAYQVINQQKFLERWRDVLRAHRPNGIEPWFERDRGIERRALIIEPTTPTPDQDAGSNTVVNTCRVFQFMGYKVTFAPEDNMLYQPRYTRPLQRIGVECAYVPFDWTLEDHLKRRGNEYDVVFVFRAETAHKHMEKLRTYAPQAPIAFHNMDIHYLRMERQAAIENRADLLQAAAEMKRKELDVVRSVDCAITHTDDERDILIAQAPDANIVVFPYMIDVVGTQVGFHDRSGLMFLGGYGHSPNVDAVDWFAGDVLPIVQRTLPDVTFAAVGANPPMRWRDLASKHIEITGRVDDLTPYFDRARVFVAPLRYGAGLKGKVATAMAHGLPCVLTSVAAEGMRLEHERHVLVADTPEDFARATVRLHEDEALWLRLQSESLEFAKQTYAVREMGVRVMTQVCDTARSAHCRKS